MSCFNRPRVDFYKAKHGRLIVWWEQTIVCRHQTIVCSGQTMVCCRQTITAPADDKAKSAFYMQKTMERMPDNQASRPLRLVIDDKIPYIRGEAEKIGRCTYLPGGKISAADVRDADILIVRTRTRCDKQLLDGSSVRFIATATIGYDHLDTAYLAEAGISWANCPGCNANSVAQYVAACLLRLEMAGRLTLREARVGIVGVGHVGRAVERAVSALGCTVLRNDPPRAEHESGFMTLAGLWDEADVLTFHTPLTYDGPYATYHLVNEALLSRLPARRPVLINSGRGEVVDNAALLRYADNFRALIMDTWEGEPEINRPLLARTFIGTPHIAGYSADGKANGTRMALEAVAQHFRLPLQFCVAPPELPETYAYNPAVTPPCEALRRYDPLRDSEALKNNPEAFERLRGAYPLRRE